MTRKSLHTWFVIGALLLAFSELAASQVDMQQRISSLNGTNSGRGQQSANAAIHSSGVALVPQDFAQLSLAPGFLVSLSVLNDSDFTGDFRVDEQGNIALPYVGNIHIAGETASEAREKIRKRLMQEKVLIDPQVSLNIMEYTAPLVTIVGEVAGPGSYPLLAPRKLIDVLALAGGTTFLAGNEVLITHGNKDSEPVLVHYSKATDPKLVDYAIVHPGDTVQVKRAGIVYVLGAVNRPGGFVMQEEGTLNLLQAISLADGTASTASIGTIHLLRRNADGTEVDIALPYKQITRGKSPDVQLQATDVLFVPSSAMKAVFINSQNVLSSAASASIYAVATH